MSPTIVLAMLAAAVLQAGWHTLVKAHNDRILALSGIHMVTAASGMVGVVCLPLPSPDAWVILALGTLVHFLYKLALIALYERGDLGWVYPMARGSAPLITTALAWWLLGHTLDPIQLLAVLSISTGVLWMACVGARNRIRDWRVVALALLTGAIVGAYSVVDSAGVARCEHWASYAAWLFLMDSLVFLAYARLRVGRELKDAIIHDRLRACGGGSIAVISFGVFLWATSQEVVGMVAALRETAVVLAVVFGAVFLNEGNLRRRFWPAVLTTIGIIAAAV